MARMIERYTPFVAWTSHDSGRGEPDARDEHVVDAGLGPARDPVQHAEEDPPQQEEPCRASQHDEEGYDVGLLTVHGLSA